MDEEKNIKKESKRKLIREKALEILKEHKEGIRYTELVKAINSAYPELNKNTIHGSVWDLDRTYPDKVIKPDKGIFLLKEHPGDIAKIKGKNPSNKLKEEDFYKKFADYLVNLRECNKAIVYGESRQGKKWENPDVIGMYEELTYWNQMPVFVSGELKISSRWEDIIQGFGQASSYLLFTHKSYLAIPNSIDPEDQRKIESLCIQFGIGLVYFDNTNLEDPKFELRNRATRHELDPYIFSKRVKEFWEKLKK